MSEPKDSGTSVCNHVGALGSTDALGPYCTRCLCPMVITSDGHFIGADKAKDAWESIKSKQHASATVADEAPAAEPKDSGTSAAIYGAYLDGVEKMRAGQAATPMVDWEAVRTAAMEENIHALVAEIPLAHLRRIGRRAEEADRRIRAEEACPYPTSSGERAVSAVMVMLIGQSEDEAAVAYDQVKEGVHCVRRREWIANAQRLIDRGEVAAWWCQLPREAREAFVKHALERQREYDEGCGSDPA